MCKLGLKNVFIYFAFKLANLYFRRNVLTNDNRQLVVRNQGQEQKIRLSHIISGVFSLY